ncbi:MAG TPA: BrnA antitoxin family protein [Rhizomicrobium sp.]|nr:BrnA antitoxin family protein [Rhizomicrobium sp.]
MNDYPEHAVYDPDNPPLTDEQLRRMRPLRDNPELLARLLAASEELRARKRGRPPLEHPKVQVTLRLDEEVVRAFKEDGPGWQGRINDELKKTVQKTAKRRRKR